MSDTEQYDRAAERWSEEAYADARTYLARRAELIATLGRRLDPGDAVLDLACGDGGVARFLSGLRYVGVDASEAMVEAARGNGVEAHVGDLNDYEPSRPVAATTVFRAIYYARDRGDFFRRVAGYTTKKLVLDVNPRQYRVADVVTDLRAAGFDDVALRPFFVPQTAALPRAAVLALRQAEEIAPLARLLLRVRFTYVISAFRNGSPRGTTP